MEFHLREEAAPSPNQATEVPTSPNLFDPVLIGTFADHGSLFSSLFLLCWFFKILTRFIEVCKQK